MAQLGTRLGAEGWLDAVSGVVELRQFILEQIEAKRDGDGWHGISAMVSTRLPDEENRRSSP